MTDCEQAPARPTEHLMQAWIYQSRWTLEEAVLLALCVSPDDNKAAEALKEHGALLARAKRSGESSGTPGFWLWWAERNNLPFHADWWLAVTPEVRSVLMASTLPITGGKCFLRNTFSKNGA